MEIVWLSDGGRPGSLSTMLDSNTIQSKGQQSRVSLVLALNMGASHCFGTSAFTIQVVSWVSHLVAGLWQGGVGQH